MRGLVLQRMRGRVPDQSARRTHLVHDVIADVDAGGAGNALDLQTFADVDAGRTHLHAQSAVDAITLALRARVGTTLARAARLAPLLVVGDHQRVAVEHGALEARVRAHVLAHLLAQNARVAVGGEAVEEDPEGLPGTERQRHHLTRESSMGVKKPTVRTEAHRIL